MKEKIASTKLPLDLGTAREKILAKLKRAGRRGAPRGGLGFTATAPYTSIEALEQALSDLLREEVIIQIFTRPIPRFFTEEDAPRIERVAEKILARAEQKEGRLLTIGDLEKALSVVEKPLAEKAATALVERAELVRLRYQSRDVFTHAGNLRKAMAADVGSARNETKQHESPEKPIRHKTAKSASSDLDLFAAGAVPKTSKSATNEETLSDIVSGAYRRLVTETGFPDVEIAELSTAADIPLGELKRQLVRANADGNAIFSFGDWSLASQTTRAGAVEIRGDRYLLVRFPAGA